MYPSFSGRLLHLLIDPAHNSKNAFNWLRKSKFIYLPGYSKLLAQVTVGTFGTSRTFAIMKKPSS